MTDPVQLELPHRCLPYVRCVCNRREHYNAQSLRRNLSALRYIHVRGPWNQLRHDVVGMCRGAIYSYAFPFLLQREDDPGEEQICSCARYRAG